MIFVGDKTQFIDTGLDEQETTTVFCDCGHSWTIPVEIKYGQWEPCDQWDMVCGECGSVGNF